jgi:PBP1b-binding outer membrane lipoprotein LpoB
MKKVISLLLCIVLISGCGKVVNKTEPDKTDNQNANQPAQSPSPSPSASPLPTPRPTETPSPSGQSSIPDFSGISNTQIGIGIFVLALTAIGIAVSCCCGCCCKKPAGGSGGAKKT